MIKKIFRGMLFVSVTLLMLDFFFVLALNNESFFLAGLIDLFFWFCAVAFGMVKLAVASIVFLLHQVAPKIIPTIDFGFGFLLDALLAFLGDILIIFINSANAGCNFLFKLFIVVCNMFAVNEIPPDAQAITLWHLVGDIKLVPQLLEKEIVLFNRAWLDDLVANLAAGAFSNIKTSRYLFFHDVMGMNVPSIIGGQSYTMIDNILGGGGVGYMKDDDSVQIVFTAY
ncbi:MAG: hypothetical protein ACTSPP_09840 [Candidatus Heimdallarchaeaceae archaeon]